MNEEMDDPKQRASASSYSQESNTAHVSNFSHPSLISALLRNEENNPVLDICRGLSKNFTDTDVETCSFTGTILLD